MKITVHAGASPFSASRYQGYIAVWLDNEKVDDAPVYTVHCEADHANRQEAIYDAAYLSEYHAIPDGWLR